MLVTEQCIARCAYSRNSASVRKQVIDDVKHELNLVKDNSLNMSLVSWSVAMVK